jgi:hypothetical protein
MVAGCVVSVLHTSAGALPNSLLVAAAGVGTKGSGKFSESTM